MKPRCTRSERCSLMSQPRREHEALVAARACESELATADDRRRFGGESTLSCRVQAVGLHRSRFSARPRSTRMTVAASNLIRLATWTYDTPAARTRRRTLGRPMAQATGVGVSQQ
jgi:hypothetical protein